MIRRMARLAWVLLGAGAACSSQPTLDSCADPLGGVWRIEDSEAPGAGPTGGPWFDAESRVKRFHIVDNGAGIEVFAMFDTTRPPDGDKAGNAEIYAPVVFDLARTSPPGGARLTGTRSQRVTRDGVICPIRVPAEITTCAGDRLTLRYEIDRGVDWNRCRTRQSGRWHSLTLRRE